MRRRWILVAVALVLAVAIGATCLWLHNKPSAPRLPTREEQLRASLETLRNALSFHAKKRGRYPSSLEEMVRSGELKSIPADPITRSTSSWRLIRESRVTTDDFLETGTGGAPADSTPIVDVRSGAPGMDSAGVPWSEY